MNWNIFYVRHWETDNNKYLIVNGWNDDVDLNDRWIEQAHETWVILWKNWYKIDKIISSPLLRAKHTANILQSYVWFKWDREIKDGFKEMDYWKFKWMSLTKISDEYWLVDNNHDIRIYIFNNWWETIEEFKSRINNAYLEIESENKWKNVLLIWHAWNFRAIKAVRENITSISEYCNYPAPKNASIVNLTEK